MTHELNRMMEQASSKLHSNLQSVAGHIEEDFEFQEPRVEITVKFLINELNPGIESIWGVCSYILTAMCYMARLFAESLRLPKGSWHERLESFRADLHECDALVKDHSSQRPSS